MATTTSPQNTPSVHWRPSIFWSMSYAPRSSRYGLADTSRRTIITGVVLANPPSNAHLRRTAISEAIYLLWDLQTRHSAYHRHQTRRQVRTALWSTFTASEVQRHENASPDNVSSQQNHSQRRMHRTSCAVCIELWPRSSSYVRRKSASWKTSFKNTEQDQGTSSVYRQVHCISAATITSHIYLETLFKRSWMGSSSLRRLTMCVKISIKRTGRSGTCRLYSALTSTLIF